MSLAKVGSNFRQGIASCLSRQLDQARNCLRLIFDVQSGNEKRRQHREIGQALILFETADLRFAIFDRDGKFALSQTRPPPQVL
jgi:hypothetical protein